MPSLSFRSRIFDEIFFSVYTPRRLFVVLDFLVRIINL